MLLQDQLNHEHICITKYSGYAARARDPQVRNMFNEFADEEQRHYDTINRLLQGTQAQTGTSAQAGSQTYSMTGNTGRTGSQTGAYQVTSGGNQQGWMSETRTVYGGQVQSNQSRSATQGQTQATGATSGVTSGTASGRTGGRTSANFEAGADMGISEGDDKSMLEDMLMTEKYISGSYDTAVFESGNPQVRQALQHIQRDEQKHGEEISKYMQQHGMYQQQ